MLHHLKLLLVHHLLLFVGKRAFVVAIYLLTLKELLLECLILVQVLHLELILLPKLLWVVILVIFWSHWVNKYTWVLLLVSIVLSTCHWWHHHHVLELTIEILHLL
jgi:hypothetical protein